MEVALSPDGRLAVVANGPLRLWDVANGVELFAGQWPKENYYAAAFAPDGKTLAVGADDGMVTLWDVSTRPRPAQLHRYRLHDRTITRLVFSPNGKNLALVGNRLKTINMWVGRVLKVCEVASGQERGARYLPPSSDSSIKALAIAPDGKMLVVAYTNPFNVAVHGQLQLLNAENLNELASRTIPTGGLTAAVFSPDGRQLATGERGGVVRLWQVADADGKPALQELGKLFGHQSQIRGLWFAPDGSMLVSGADDQTVRLWDNPPRLEPAIMTGNGQPYRALALAPDGRALATMERLGRLRVWDLTTQQPRADLELTAHSEPGCIPAFSPDGALLAMPQSDYTVKVWEVAGGKLRATLQGHANVVRGTAFRPDGRVLATASSDGTIKLWDVATWQEKATLRGHTWVVWSVMYSPDGRVLASGDDFGKVLLWDADTCQVRASLNSAADLPPSGLMALAFSPDGKTLAAATYHARIHLWRLDNGQQFVFPRRHRAAIVSIVFAPDAQTLITGSKDGTIKFWDVLTRQERLTFREHTNQVHGLALTRDGETLVSVGEDGTIRLWHAPGYQHAQEDPPLR
jgi:WD40 repeat protein